MKTYNVYEAFGNYSFLAFTSDSFNECQDYLENRLLESEVDIDNESEVENFYSYFSIEEA